MTRAGLTQGGRGEKGLPRLRAFLRHPVTVAVLCFLIAAGVYAPEVYSAVDVSGGVPDTEYFVTLVGVRAEAARGSRSAPRGLRSAAAGRLRVLRNAAAFSKHVDVFRSTGSLRNLRKTSDRR